jgi:threonine aldolase
MAIDLRSDTVTLPSPRMREAMAHAEVGDDVFGEDPTVAALEAHVAERAGKDAAVFVPSGTMGNLSSLLAHGQRGTEVILGDESHIYHYEAGGASALGGLVFHPLATRPDGVIPVEAIEAALRPPADWLAPPGVICLENTHNRCSGAIVAPEYVEAVATLARTRGLPVHLDGARLFNAAVARGLPISAWTRHVTSVMISLSKGLAAPVGSVVAGPGSSWRVRGAPARCSAAACGRRAFWPPPGWWRSRRWSTAWPRITPTPACWPRASRSCRESSSIWRSCRPTS